MQAQIKSAEDELIRARLLQGLASAIIENGYAATTIADIAKHARVSKRTIYEHFADKDEVFLALYTAASGELIRMVMAAAVQDAPWEQQIDLAVREYLRALEEQPELARTFFLEIQAAGEKAIAMRRQVHKAFAEMIRTLVDHGREGAPEVAPLSMEMATAMVGGINELVLLAIEQGRGRRLSELRDAAAEFVRKLLLPAEGPRRRR